MTCPRRGAHGVYPTPLLESRIERFYRCKKTPSRESFPFVRFNRREEKCGLELSDLPIREYFARENRIGQVFNEIKLIPLICLR